MVSCEFPGFHLVFDHPLGVVPFVWKVGGHRSPHKMHSYVLKEISLSLHTTASQCLVSGHRNLLVECVEVPHSMHGPASLG